VGRRYSFVDSAFLTWFGVVPQFLGDVMDLEREFPNVGAWLARLHARPAIAKVVKDREDAMDAHSLQGVWVCNAISRVRFADTRSWAILTYTYHWRRI
jgi:isopentenyl diphosphate isomerase/L-lactate dehydrogenase-like FMN-dependent dehydrogenase